MPGERLSVHRNEIPKEDNTLEALVHLLMSWYSSVWASVVRIHSIVIFGAWGGDRKVCVWDLVNHNISNIGHTVGSMTFMTPLMPHVFFVENEYYLCMPALLLLLPEFRNVGFCKHKSFRRIVARKNHHPNNSTTASISAHCQRQYYPISQLASKPADTIPDKLDTFLLGHSLAEICITVTIDIR